MGNYARSGDLHLEWHEGRLHYLQDASLLVYEIGPIRRPKFGLAQIRYRLLKRDGPLLTLIHIGMRLGAQFDFQKFGDPTASAIGRLDSRPTLNLDIPKF